MKWRSTAAAIVFVLLAYTFFASTGKFTFPRIDWGNSLYAAQAQGFLTGHLSMSYVADPRLALLYDPYKISLRDAFGVPYIWDASYYKGRYYLYFTPLPALMFYIPMHWIRGRYPPDSLAALVFASWAFLMCVAIARRALSIDGRTSVIPFPLWVLLLGFGSVIPFLLPLIRMYEIAIFATTAFGATWAYALLRFVEQPSPRRAFWVCFWLALAISARPNLGLLLFVTAYAFWRSTDREMLRRVAIAGLIPLAAIGIAAAAYNYARFGNPLEFGVKYQLTYVPMRDYAVCSLCKPAEFGRLINGVNHYVFWPPVFQSTFPFIDAQGSRVDPAVSFPGGSEQVIGIGALVPLTLIASMLTLMIGRDERRSAGTRTALYLMSASWLVLLGLSTCWWFVSRYALDFMLIMITATIVVIESGLAYLANAGIPTRPIRIAAILMASYSIAIGLLLGFMGHGQSFQQVNPDLFNRIAGAVRSL